MAIDHRIWHPYTDGSLGSKLRAKRWEMLNKRFPDFADMRVLDVGGVAEAWARAPVKPREVVLLNVRHYTPESPEPWMTTMTGDACDPPDWLTGERFDFVYSNSVIEHVGGHWRRQRFAETVRGLAPHHWVQTPNRWFPLEPHWFFPGAQFLPVPLRKRLTVRWPLGNYGDLTDPGRAIEETLDVELLDATQMRFYFPDGDLVRERVAGLAKSLIAVR